MEKRLYNQPAIKILSVKMYGDVCTEPLTMSDIPANPAIYAGPDIEDIETSMF